MKVKNFLMIIVLVVIGCSNKEELVYEPTPEAIHLGSKIYASNEVNCKSCHGNDYKSNTSDAQEIKDSGVNVPDFTAEISPEKTPLDYFKAISVGTPNTGNEMFNYHAYYSLTDKAKWALANFLYSLGKEPSTKEGKNIRKQALQKALQEVQSVYSKNRKWYLGKNTSSFERERPQPLDELIQKANYKIEKEESYTALKEEQIQKIFDLRKENYEGAFLYKTNCENCHGMAGEGVQGSLKINLLDESRSEPIKNIARRKSSYIGIPILESNQIQREKIEKIHPEYLFTENQWNDLINYLKKITEN
ncbi:MAG: c-type cytochrome [Leptonema sp. (in: bacteria)]